MGIDLNRIGWGFLYASIALLVGYTGATWAAAPPLHTDGADYAPPETLFGAGNADKLGGVYAIGGDGTVTWEYHNANYYNDVERMRDGRIRATFTVTERGDACEPYDSPCGRTGVRIIDRENRTIDWEYSFIVGTRVYSEVHDAEFLEDRGDLLIVDMDRERVFAIDTETKEITWQWNASQRYDAPDDPTKSDWLHMNDVDRIGPGRYLVSVRNANELVVLDRSCTCVVEVINEGGDPSVLRQQHNPQWLGDDAVLVADSENDRVVELHRNESGEWVIAWAAYGANGVSFDWPRDADRLPNGNTLITDTRNNRLVEIDQDGTAVWSARAPEQGYDADRAGTEYPDATLPIYTAREQTEPLDQPIYAFDVVYSLIRHHVPLPYWVSDWHVLVLALSFDLASVGAIAMLVGQFREGREVDS